MSKGTKDIRSYFTPLSKQKANGPDSWGPVKKKARAIIIDSDDEDIIPVTPEAVKQDPNAKSKHKSKARQDTNKSRKDNKNTTKLKPIDINEAFAKTPIHQSELAKKSQENKNADENLDKPTNKDTKSTKKINVTSETEVHNDPTFSDTLVELNDYGFMDNILNEITEKETEHDQNGSGKNSKKRSRNDSATERSSPKKPKLDQSDSGIDPDQERHEKRRLSAMLYKQYLNRAEPKNLGKKDYPKGKPNCLSNLCFLKTGVLDSLKSDTFDELIKQHGGRTVQSVSRKVNYLVIGEDAGPSKLEKARNFNIPTISEDELLDMILVKSGLEAKYNKKSSSLEGDSGISSDACSSQSFEKSPSIKNKKVEDFGRIPEKNSSSKTKLAKDDANKPLTNDASQKKSSKTKGDVTKILTRDISPNKSAKNKSPEKMIKSVDLPQIERPKVDVDRSTLSLCDKYSPKCVSDVIGQANCANKLKNWLRDWQQNRKRYKNAVPYDKTGNSFKCVLLSGPPGVGKTTTATLVCKELGLDVVEFNASDKRNKKLLHEEVSQVLNNNTIGGFTINKFRLHHNRVLIMDEVDGMSGNEDRGGIQELINLIKHTNIPIICICNDRNHQKLRSLLFYCYDLRFNKPKNGEIQEAMQTICHREGIEISSDALLEIINGTGCDVRQTFNHLTVLGASGKRITLEDAQNEAKNTKKDAVLGPWDVCRMVFSESENKNRSVGDRSRLFFYDYSMGPLFILENYLRTSNSNNTKWLKAATAAANSISMGFEIESKIRRTNNWALLEYQSYFSSVIPGHCLAGDLKRIQFPAWLGNNSKKNKRNRIITQLFSHTKGCLTGNKLSFLLDYAKALKNAVTMPLIKNGMDGVESAIDVMKSYTLLREDFDSLMEFTSYGKGKQLPPIDSRVKAAFTKTYNKKVPLLPHAPKPVPKKKTSATGLDDEEQNVDDDDGGGGGGESNDEQADSVERDAMIKKKAPPKSRKKEAGPSKKTEKKSAKGKRGK